MYIYIIKILLVISSYFYVKYWKIFLNNVCDDFDTRCSLSGISSVECIFINVLLLQEYNCIFLIMIWLICGKVWILYVSWYRGLILFNYLFAYCLMILYQSKLGKKFHYFSIYTFINYLQRRSINNA